MTRILPFRSGKTREARLEKPLCFELTLVFFPLVFDCCFCTLFPQMSHLGFPFCKCLLSFVLCRLFGCPRKQTHHAWIQASGVRLWRCGQVRAGECPSPHSSLHTHTPLQHITDLTIVASLQSWLQFNLCFALLVLNLYFMYKLTFRLFILLVHCDTVRHREM